MHNKPIAILIDGGYFLRRLPHLVAEKHCNTPEAIVKMLHVMCRNHVIALRQIPKIERATWHQHVYRIFYYDAQPYKGKEHHPLLNRQIYFETSKRAQEQQAIFELLRRHRKVALRLGKVNKDSEWSLRSKLTKSALKSIPWTNALDRLPITTDSTIENTVLNLSPDEVHELNQLRLFWKNLPTNAVNLGLKQKGVDMRIGVDIASITLKKQASTIVLVSGDSDFVPAAKLARREGMEFILDPLWQKVNDDLYEHIDGLQSGLPKPPKKTTPSTTPCPIATPNHGHPQN